MPQALFVLLVALALMLIGWWLLRPNAGRLWRWRRLRRANKRVRREDALKHVHRCERHGYRATLESLAGALNLGLDETTGLLMEMVDAQLLFFDGPSVQLTLTGHLACRNIRWRGHCRPRLPHQPCDGAQCPP